MGSKETVSGLSRREQRFLEIAKSVARTSRCRQKHGAVIVVAGNVLATGVNKDRNSPLNLRYPEVLTGASYHAEFDAIRKLQYKIPYRATIYVARVNKQNIPRLSRPCNQCWNLLQQYNIHEVVYTT